MLAAIAYVFIPEAWLDGARESWFDTLTQVARPTLSDRILVVDIDSRTVASAQGGNWTAPTPRGWSTASPRRSPQPGFRSRLFHQLPAGPAGKCRPRQGDRQGTLGARFPDFGTRPAGARAAAALAIAKSLTVPELWFIEGAEASCPVFADKAASSAAPSWSVTTMPGSAASGYSIIGSDPFPALAIEAVRLADHVATPILGGTPPWLKVGKHRFDLAEDGAIRFVAKQCRSPPPAHVFGATCERHGRSSALRQDRLCRFQPAAIRGPA